MTITLDDLAKLRAGWRTIVAVGDLPVEVARRMGVHSTTVYLTGESLQHIYEEHPKVRDTEILFACLALREGWIMQEIGKPIYLCSYLEPLSRRRYAVILKVAKPDREVLLVSFRHAKYRQTRAWQKRCKTIKTHS